MKTRKKLAAAEWEIMNELWNSEGPSTVREVHGRLYPQGQKAYTTVQTIMNILVEKGFLSKQKIGMVNFYRPVLSRKKAMQQETRSLVARAFDGSFGALANYLVDSGQLSESELRELQSWLDAKQSDRQ